MIVSGSLTLTRLVPRRRSPVPSLFWFIHTFCGCPRRRSHVPSHRFWSGVTPAAPAQPRAEKEKTPRDEAASESPSGLSFPRPPGACALAHTREETGRAAQEREKEREHRQRERGLLVHQPCREREGRGEALLVNPSLALVRARGAGPLCPLSSGSFTLFVVVRGAGPMCPLTGFGPV